MGSIDTYIRAAIKKMSAGSPEERNQIYLAARETIQKLPPEKSATAMQELFDSVSAIEAEFVRIEMAAYKPVDSGKKENGDRQGWFQRVRNRWFAILSIAVVLAIFAFSAFLLITEYKKAGIDFRSSFNTSQPWMKS